MHGGLDCWDTKFGPPFESTLISYLLLRGYSSYVFTCSHFLLMKLKELCFSELYMPLFTQAFYFFTPAYFSLARNIYSLSFLMALFKLHVTWWVLPVDSGKGSRRQLHWGRGVGRSTSCYMHKDLGYKSNSTIQSSWWPLGRQSNSSGESEFATSQ